MREKTDDEVTGDGASPGRSRWRSFGLFLIVAAAVIAAALYQYRPRPQPVDEPLIEAGVQVTQQQAPLPAAVPDPQTESAPDADDQPPIADASLDDRAAADGQVADLHTQLMQLDQAISSVANSLTAMGGGLSALSARVAVLESKRELGGLDADAAGKISTSLALRDLERALSGPGPFEIELLALSKLDGFPPDDAGITGLQKFAMAGIPTRSLLTVRFAGVATAIARADSAAKQNGWSGLLGEWAGAVFTIRPLGEREGDSASAVAARAEMRLSEGDMEAAVRELEALQGGAAEAAAAWLNQARARLMAEREVAQLNARFAQSLGGK